MTPASTSTSRRRVEICLGDVTDKYASWATPTAIVADGPYGVGGFPGDPITPDSLAEWYEPHIAAWSEKAEPFTTLWIWNTEVGWATVHPVLIRHGWQYVGCNIWNKGIAHIAGNCNTKTLRQFPIVTEVCAQYVRPATFEAGGKTMSMKQWLRWEWQRSGLPLRLTNEACGVKNAATRKYFTQCDLWYFPPPEAMEKVAVYANENGQETEVPYFSLDGQMPLTAEQWRRMRALFKLQPGLTNVWDQPALRGHERVRVDKAFGHPNQKPLVLMRRIIGASTTAGDVVWEPFGGLCSAAIASLEMGRACHSAELLPAFFQLASDRLHAHVLRAGSGAP